MRMLQESGLVSSEPNMRSRVVGFDPDDIEALYIKRIMLESFGVSVTTRTMSVVQREGLREVADALESEHAHNDFTQWQKLHGELHRRMVIGVGEPLLTNLCELEQHSVRYQSAYKGEHLAGWWQRGEVEHRLIYDAMVEGDVANAAERVARHLARTALELLAALAPEHDTSRLRASLNYAIAAVRTL